MCWDCTVNLNASEVMQRGEKFLFRVNTIVWVKEQETFEDDDKINSFSQWKSCLCLLIREPTKKFKTENFSNGECILINFKEKFKVQ